MMHDNEWSTALLARAPAISGCWKSYVNHENGALKGVMRPLLIARHSCHTNSVTPLRYLSTRLIFFVKKHGSEERTLKSLGLMGGKELQESKKTHYQRY